MAEPHTPTHPALVDIAAVAAQLGVSKRHVRRLITDRGLPHHKIGHYLRFDPLEVRAWIATTRRTRTAPPIRETR